MGKRIKSIYQNKTFATYWDLKVGDGEVYKRLISDPFMLGCAGSLRHKVILDLGCGNGYLGKKLLMGKPDQIIMLDIPKHNLEFARLRCQDKAFRFVEQDVEMEWKEIADQSVDVIYSNMLFNEISTLKIPFEEAQRVLKKSGKFVFSVTHPAWDLYEFAQEKAGIKSHKILGLKNYFHRGMTKFVMRGDNKSNPLDLPEFKDKIFEVEHFHWTISDYFNQLTSAGFQVKKIIEPEVSKELLKECPKFSDRLDFPLSLIFDCTKSH